MYKEKLETLNEEKRKFDLEVATLNRNNDQQ